MILTHVTACSENLVIGVNGGLPWNIPEDMKFFRDTTRNHVMIMGRKTFDSFLGKPLPNRYHIVITRDASSLKFQADEQSPVSAAKSVEEAVALAKTLTEQWGEEVFIIGGGEIYKQTMGITDKIYLTVIHQKFQGDTYYPQVNEKEFNLVKKSDRTEPVPFSFLTYLRS